MAETTLKDRMIQFIEYLGISVHSFERKVGLSNATVAKMGYNTRRSTIEKISKQYPALNPNWLITGEGEMLNPTAPMDVDIDLKMGNHSQMAFRDINNASNEKTQMVVMQERIKSLEAQIKEKDARIAELTKVNNYLMDRK